MTGADEKAVRAPEAANGQGDSCDWLDDFEPIGYLAFRDWFGVWFWIPDGGPVRS